MKLPPFSLSLGKFFSTGKIPKNDIYLFCGMSAWRKAKYFSQHRFTLCLPPYEEPGTYYWPVKNRDVLLFDTGNLDVPYIEETVFCLLRAGSPVVRVVSCDSKIFIYRKREVSQ